jgi:hypothetical protein
MCVCVGGVGGVREKSVDRIDSDFIRRTRIIHTRIRKKRLSIDSIVVRHSVYTGEEEFQHVRLFPW